MPSTIVHMSLAAILAVAFLRDDFDIKGLALILAVVAFVDFDVFLGLWIRGAHRAAFHNLLVPGLVAIGLYVDTRMGPRSALRQRFGDRGVRVAWATVAVVVLAAIGPDLFTNGVNVFYPVHDEFYKLNGKILLSNKHGFVQTFVDLSPPKSSHGGQAGKVAIGSTKNVQYYTGVDPNPGKAGADSGNVERVFPIVQSGWQLLIVLTSIFVVGSRLYEEYR